MCLDSIVANDYPKDRMEVLVVDGMSNDGTQRVVEGYAGGCAFIRAIKNPKKITPVALNVGIRNARGEIIIRMDAHAEYPPHYVATAVKYLRETEADVVGGPIITKVSTKTCVARGIALATAHPFGVGNSKFRTSRKEGYVDTVPFGAYKREVFLEVGLFNEQLERNQDNELNSRIIEHGGKIYSTPELTAIYYNQATLAGLIRQAMRTGMWNVFTVLANQSAFKLRHFVPFAFVTGAMGLLFMVLIQSWAKSILYGLLGLYGIAAIVSTTSIWVKERNFSALFLLLIFPTYHISYGLGTWAGIWKVLLSKMLKSSRGHATDENSTDTA